MHEHVSRFSTRSRRQTGGRSSVGSCCWWLANGGGQRRSKVTMRGKARQLATSPGYLIALFLLSVSYLPAATAAPTTKTTTPGPLASRLASNLLEGGLDAAPPALESVRPPTGNESEELQGQSVAVLPSHGLPGERDGLLASAVATNQHVGREQRQVATTLGAPSVNNTLDRPASWSSSSSMSTSPEPSLGQWAISSSGSMPPKGDQDTTAGAGRPKTMADYGDDAELTVDDNNENSPQLGQRVARRPELAALAANDLQPLLNWALVESAAQEEEDEDGEESSGATNDQLGDANESASAFDAQPNPSDQSNGDELALAKRAPAQVQAPATANSMGAGSSEPSSVATDRLGKLDGLASSGPELASAQVRPNEFNGTKPETTTGMLAATEADNLKPAAELDGRDVRALKWLHELGPFVGRATQVGGDEQESRFYYYHNNNEPPSSRKIRPFCFGHKEPAAKWYSWTCTGFQMMDTIPPELKPKPTILRLSMVGLGTLTADALQPYKETLRDFSIENAPRLQIIERNAFANLTRLRVVYIFQAPRLVSFDFVLAGHHPDLAIVRIQQTGLRRWPDLSEFRQQRLLTSIDLDNNRIESLGSKPINIRAEVVNLEFNHITSIDEHIFNGSEIGALSLSGNRQLTFIHKNAFANLKNLIKLDLSSTSLSQLPAAGLHQLRHLKIQDNYALKQIPSIFVFPMLEEAQLTYSFHCCSFRYPKTHDPSAYEEHIRLQNEINAVCSKRQNGGTGDSGSVGVPVGSQRLTSGGGGEHSKDHELAYERMMRFRRSAGGGVSDLQAEHELGSTTPSSDFEGSFFDADRQQQPTGGSSDNQQASSPLTTTARTLTAQATDDMSSAEVNMTNHRGSGSSLKEQWLLQNIECGELVQKRTGYQNIVCTPAPDAFNPCEDIMGYPVLRVAVWFVVACSICGNMSVIVVLLGIFRRLSVPKFLQLNLAIGDLFMGVYLAMLAAADLTTVGTYFNFALDWQHGLGCQLAGASSLFASQLSIFTLIVITFERYYTITYSIDLNMRLQLGWAARIMLIGWIYAFASAMLPIFANINSYSKTSICLPMRTTYKMDRIFILVLLVVDSCAFLIIFICYLRMYLLILKQKTEATLKERTVAMRMALLVLTDFACWAPIIFFSSTAVFGRPLISVTNSKILIVFFYPLNSMANPFLYVLSTRQYRRDLNYLISRWHHWRKNLFKSREDKDYSFNNSNPYGKYPIAMNAHLNAVAAVTGVANHLHGYRIPINGNQQNGRGGYGGYGGGGGQQVELIKFGPDSNEGGSGEGQPADPVRHSCRHMKHCGHTNHNNCNNHHHHHHHHHHRHITSKQHKPNGIRQVEKERVACAIKLDGQQANGRPTGAQYIIRHQILPEKCALGSHHTLSMTRTTRMISYTTPIKSPADNGTGIPRSPKWEQLADIGAQKTNGQPQNYNTVKLGLVIDDQERVSSLADSQEDSAVQAVDMDSSSRLALVGSDGVQEKGESTNSVSQPGELGLELATDQHQQHHGHGHHETRRSSSPHHHHHHQVRSRSNDANKIETSPQQQRQTSTRVCRCGHKTLGSSGDVASGDTRSKSANWTSRLNIRRDRQKAAHKSATKTGSPSKSAQTTVTTDANTNSSTTTSTTKSCTEPDLETTGTTGSINETTTTTGNEDSQVCSEPDGERAHEKSNCGHHHHHHRDHQHHRRPNHHHHHHHHQRHHHNRLPHSHHESHRRSCARESSCSRTSEGPAKGTLERITESSNTDRSSTPKQCDRTGSDQQHGHQCHQEDGKLKPEQSKPSPSGDENEKAKENHQRHRRRHYHHHHHHRHCRGQDRQCRHHTGQTEHRRLPTLAQANEEAESIKSNCSRKDDEDGN